MRNDDELPSLREIVKKSPNLDSVSFNIYAEKVDFLYQDESEEILKRLVYLEVHGDISSSDYEKLESIKSRSKKLKNFKPNIKIVE